MNIKLKTLDSTEVPYKLRIDKDTIDYEAIDQFKQCLSMKGCLQGFLAPDYHKGYSAPIGSVLKFDNIISPELVGFDIGCGMCAAKLDITPKELNLEQLKEDILTKIPIGFSRHAKPKSYELPEVTAVAKQAYETAGKYQLGTLGGGNHFIELGTGDEGNLWIVIHSGSRGFGHKIATHYMKEAAIYNTDEERYKTEFSTKNTDWLKAIFKETNEAKQAKLKLKYEEAQKEFVYRRVRARLDTNMEGYFSLPLDSEAGKNYLKDMNCALDFALANRQAMITVIIDSIANQLEVKPIIQTFINRNHNHAEVKSNNKVIHRKGATQADRGMYGVIPGNMKDGSFIVKGMGNKDSMCSSSHGAGRVLSRRKAKETLSVDTFNTLMTGITTNHTDKTVDESPEAYKNIFEVMEAQKDLVQIMDRVVPILNIKG